jgi:integrating conjugative element protein (TIGR03756 family)
MINKIMFSLLFTIAIIAKSEGAINVDTTSISTADIISAPITDRSCHNYCLTGVCVWLRCGFGCSIKTSIRVRHYNPDLVVSVYEEAGNNPWSDAKSIFGATERASASALVDTFHDAPAGFGARTEGGSYGADRSLRFKEATAIGHPLSGFTSLPVEYWCPSEADPFVPYFSSSYDALAWRLGLAEMFYLQNFLPGARVVGEGYAQQWGGVFPRTGFINQKDDVKAGAVIAQRVGDIVTRDYQPHVYQTFGNVYYNRIRLPGELRENDPDTGIWQMLAPKEDKQCYVFGENDVLNTPWSANRQSDDKAYAYALWRQYECCKAKGSYITTIEMEVCL